MKTTLIVIAALAIVGVISTGARADDYRPRRFTMPPYGSAHDLEYRESRAVQYPNGMTVNNTPRTIGYSVNRLDSARYTIGYSPNQLDAERFVERSTDDARPRVVYRTSPPSRRGSHNRWRRSGGWGREHGSRRGAYPVTPIIVVPYPGYYIYLPVHTVSGDFGNVSFRLSW